MMEVEKLHKLCRDLMRENNRLEYENRELKEIDKAKDKIIIKLNTKIKNGSDCY